MDNLEAAILRAFEDMPRQQAGAHAIYLHVSAEKFYSTVSEYEVRELMLKMVKKGKLKSLEVFTSAV